MYTPANTDTFEPEGYYHLFNHAIGDENLFRNNGNYQYFLTKFGQYINPVCKVYAYCLMPNHFHFLIQVKKKAILEQYYLEKFPTSINPSIDYNKLVMQQFSNMLNGYAQAYNKMFVRKGALFIDYLRRKQVADDAYFIRLVHYIHNNPVHHHFCSSMEDWTYSSHQTMLSEKSTNLERESVLEWYGGALAYKDFQLHAVELQNEIEL
jgi:putative transposase